MKFYRHKKIIAFTLSLFLFPFHSWAKGGNFALSGNLGITTSSQSDVNTIIKNTNTAVSGVSTSELGNAWELGGFFQYRTSGSLALQFRPSYFYQKQSSGSSYEYSVTGFLLFPVMRYYLLEDKFIKFFTNLGIGYGRLSGDIKDGASDSVSFSGGNLGYMAGLGAEFCFFGGSHCLNLEANFRYLDVDRVVADSGKGSAFTRTVTQATSGQEVEINGKDLDVNMSGVNMFIGYIYYY